MSEQNPFNFNDDDTNIPLRVVTLESLAAYLDCEPQCSPRLCGVSPKLPVLSRTVRAESAWPVNLTGDGTK